MSTATLMPSGPTDLRVGALTVPTGRIWQTPARDRRFLGYAGLVIAAGVVFGTWTTGFNPWEAITGLGPLAAFIAEDFLPPVVNNWTVLMRAVLDTVALAFTATFVASALAFVAALFGTKAISPLPWLSPVIRGLATFVRNIPDLVWAVILVTALGVGTHVGFAALTLSSFAFLTRAFIEAMDEISAESVEALSAVGASFPVRVVQAIVPPFTKDYIAWFLYNLEVSIRGATIVGMVGGGGIGMLLSAQMRNFRWFPRATGTILVLAALVIVVDLLTNYLRKKLLNPGAAVSVSAMKRDDDAVIVRGRISVKKKGRDLAIKIFMWATVVLSLLAFVPLNINWDSLFGRAYRLGRTFIELGNLNFMAWNSTWNAFLETISVAVLATFYSAILALLIAPFASRNLMRNRVTPLFITSIATFIRTIPNPVVVLIAISSFGLGPVPGIVGLTLSSTAFFVRAYAQGFEDVPLETIEALQATGASRVQVFMNAVLPAARSHLVAWTGMRFEMNFMGSAILGMVGAGGIGAEILRATNGRQLGVAGVGILLVFLFAFTFEQVLTRVKRNFIR
ncbi:MAG: ABC transporter permease subunit [Promicromonosporaceae bacterium]|nr:ABC transporter permease subunit [Promicromonosporaceae bacterium]